MKKAQMFDDQRQPMSPWLEKLANDESPNFTNEDLKDDTLAVKHKAAYTGISSTWDKSSATDSTPAPMLSDSIRHPDNRPTVLASSESIEKEARKLLMTGLSLEKVASVLKKKYESIEIKAFDIAKLEPEYGKLGHVYVDASLVDTCNDLSTLLKNASHVSSIAIRDVKRSAKCNDCNFNKSNCCVKLGLNIVDSTAIKTASEAKFVLNKFASLKYVNSFFIKASDITKYYSRLASENPEKVVSDFLIDVNTRRTAKQHINTRLAVKETIANELKNKEAAIKMGKDDIEMSNAFKQLLINNPSIRTAKSELTKKYSNTRVETFLKEARDDLKRYINFLSTKSLTANSRDAITKESSSTKLHNKTSVASIDSATKMAYTLKTLRQSDDAIKSAVSKSYSADVANHVMGKLAADKEAQMLGLTYIDSNLYSNASELQAVLPMLNRRANNMIFQIKEGPLCKLSDNTSGICKITGLTIVKNAAVDTKKQAASVIEHAKSVNLANKFELDRIASKLKDSNNTDTIRYFIADVNKGVKKISSSLVKQLTDVALKYAKDINVVRKIASTSWTSTLSLVRVLEPQVTNKVAFSSDVKAIIKKTASDVSMYMKPTNQYDVDVYSPDKDTVSDVTLGKTF
jgi:hypothetical protein